MLPNLISPIHPPIAACGTPSWLPRKRQSEELTSRTCTVSPCAKIAPDFEPLRESLMSRFRALPVFVSLFAAVSVASAANPELTSEGLEQRVDFWKKVYTQYGE